MAELASLVHLTPALLSELGGCLPESMSGAAFLKEYGAHGDAVTTVSEEANYAVAKCTAHPVHENHRVTVFESLLRAAPCEGQLELLGELMYQSHASYSTIGLGSDATDLIVRLVRSMGPESGIYGAKITGGGSGGTVCVLGEASERAEASLQKLLAEYRARSGHEPYVVLGSSAGAVEFGTLKNAKVDS